jgi:nickel/cobalt transporter (NicO) family protein
MDTIFDLQRWLYAGAVAALNSLQTAGLTAVPGLIAAAFGFGMLHALLPGHGKAVLTSYYAGDGQWRGALLSTSVLIVTHVGSAIVIVLGGFAVLQRTIGSAGRAPALELASNLLIMLVGFWLLRRAVKTHTHDHDQSSVPLAFVTGLVPCPLTTFIMTYAVVNGLVGAGLILSGMFATGMFVTVVSFPLAAIILRTKLVPFLARTQSLRIRVGRTLEIAAAIAIVAIGLLPILQRYA